MSSATQPSTFQWCMVLAPHVHPVTQADEYELKIGVGGKNEARKKGGWRIGEGGRGRDGSGPVVVEDRGSALCKLALSGGQP